MDKLVCLSIKSTKIHLNPANQINWSVRLPRRAASFVFVQPVGRAHRSVPPFPHSRSAYRHGLRMQPYAQCTSEPIAQSLPPTESSSSVERWLSPGVWSSSGKGKVRLGLYLLRVIQQLPWKRRSPWWPVLPSWTSPSSAWWSLGKRDRSGAWTPRQVAGIRRNGTYRRCGLSAPTTSD